MAGISPRPKPFRGNAHARGTRRMAYGMIGISFMMYAAVVAISYVGQDYTHPRLPPIANNNDAEEDLGLDDPVGGDIGGHPSIHDAHHEDEDRHTQRC